VVNGEMLRRLKLSICEVVTLEEEEEKKKKHQAMECHIREVLLSSVKNITL
jgi:hypothetical protein